MKEYAAGFQTSDLRLVEASASSRPETEDESGAAPAEGDAGASDFALSQDATSVGTFAPQSGSAPSGLAVAAESSPSDDAPPSADRVDESPTAEDVAQADPGTADKFLTAATKEFDAGIVDQALWKWAIVQTGGDRTRATETYLRARATALRVSKRDKRQERSARRARAMSELGQPTESPAAPNAPASEPRPAARPRGAQPKHKQVLWIGGVLASLFVIAVLVTVRSGNGVAQQSGAKPPTSASAEQQAPANATAAAVAPNVRPATAAAKPAIESIATENLAGKMETLKSAGNWNMVVLYAVEWARKQPENPQPWRELSAGYLKLHQYREALDATTRVTQLASDDAAAWRSLGEINVALQQPVEALAAFQEAVARNDRDSASIVQIGTINTQLGRLPDAQSAFAKALALNASDVDALCGSQTIAQKEGREKDADALARQISTLDGRCRDANPGQTVRVAVGTKKTAPASRPANSR
jgi:hypothetical protein